MEHKRRIPIGPRGPGEATQREAPGPQEEAGSAGAEEAWAGEGGTTGTAREGAAAGADGPAEQESEPLAAVVAERDSYLDGLLRLKAEFENYRKRSNRERDEAESRARSRLLLDFLPILDNLGRALDAAEHHEESKVLDGVRLTHSLFQSLLQKEGVTEDCPLGQPFDPSRHEAMMTQPSSEPEGTVTAVLERGYLMGDRVVRPARVAVSSGPASSGPAGPGPAGARAPDSEAE